MSYHAIEPERATLHGRFSRDLPPALTIDPGDTVRFRTLDAGWNLEPRRSTRSEDRPRKFAPRIPERDSGHALCGPVAIRGAQPGMTLGVTIASLRTGTWGWTAAGGWDSPLNSTSGTACPGLTPSRWRVCWSRCASHSSSTASVARTPSYRTMLCDNAATEW